MSITPNPNRYSRDYQSSIVLGTGNSKKLQRPTTSYQHTYSSDHLSHAYTPPFERALPPRTPSPIKHFENEEIKLLSSSQSYFSSPLRIEQPKQTLSNQDLQRSHLSVFTQPTPTPSSTAQSSFSSPTQDSFAHEPPIFRTGQKTDTISDRRIRETDFRTAQVLNYIEFPLLPPKQIDKNLAFRESPDKVDSSTAIPNQDKISTTSKTDFISPSLQENVKGPIITTEMNDPFYQADHIELSTEYIPPQTAFSSTTKSNYQTPENAGHSRPPSKYDKTSQMKSSIVSGDKGKVKYDKTTNKEHFQSASEDMIDRQSRALPMMSTHFSFGRNDGDDNKIVNGRRDNMYDSTQRLSYNNPHAAPPLRVSKDFQRSSIPIGTKKEDVHFTSTQRQEFRKPPPDLIVRPYTASPYNNSLELRDTHFTIGTEMDPAHYHTVSLRTFTPPPQNNTLPSFQNRSRPSSRSTQLSNIPRGSTRFPQYRSVSRTAYNTPRYSSHREHLRPAGNVSISTGSMKETNFRLGE